MKITIPVSVGNVMIGGGNPVVIQSMTDTDTADVSATVQQILELKKAGAEVVRITVDRPESAEAVPQILQEVQKVSKVPIVGDFHFNGHVLLKKYPKMAMSLDKYRINPGNIGRGEKKDEHFEQFLEVAKKYKKPIRIGGNGGSVDPELLQKRMDENIQATKVQSKKVSKSGGEIFEETLIESVLSSAEYAVQFGIPKNKIILSAKVSSPHSLIRIHRILSQKTDFPLHVGLTEAGGGVQGIVATTAALSPLLQESVGDTIRVSITPASGQSRTQEVEVAKQILQANSVRQFSPKIISCPGCGRTTGNNFRNFAEDISKKIEKSHLPKTLTIAVMGCIVNGPGEANQADAGIFFPGKGEGTHATVFVRGEKVADLSGGNIENKFLEILEEEFVDKK